MFENELIVAAQKKFNKVVQMGVQQRSSLHTIEIINEIHNGIIGSPYKATAFYTNGRGEVPVQKSVPVREGLDWELFQGPAPRRDYTQETWALQVDYPIRVDVEADKRHFVGDGWEMYDTMEATFRFDGDKVIQWDGKSRNGYSTYGSGRGTIIYGSEGTVFVNREGYTLYDRSGKVIKDSQSASNESGTALGGGGDMSTAHIENFFDAIRGKSMLNGHIADGAITMALVHYSNIAYRIGKGFDIDDVTGRMYDRDAMKLWGREYEPGWEPKI